MGKRYTLSLTPLQLHALKSAFDGNFSGGYEDGGNPEEIKVGKRLDRLSARAYADRKRK